MKLNDQKRNIASIVLSVVIFVLTFPSLAVTQYNGLDASYFWALNYFFADYRQIFAHLVFPFGPLGFLKSPFFVGQNFIIGLVFIASARLILTLILLELGRKNKLHLIVNVLITFIILLFSNLDFTIIGLVITGILLSEKAEQRFYILISLFFAALAVFIKSSLGVSCFSIILIYAIIRVLKKKYGFLILFFGVTTILGLVLIGNFQGYYHFLFSTWKMITGYTASLSLFPENNWLLLSISILLFFAIPFFFRKKEVYLLYVLMMFVSFASWKHAMVREDIYHYRIFIIYLIIFYAFVALNLTKKTLWITGLMIVSVFCFILNMRNIPGYEKPLSFSNGPTNFYKHVLHYNSFKDQSERSISESLKSFVMDDYALEIIGNSTIDFFPWELSYVPANKLNWKPRPTLQAGAYSPWIDSVSASCFNDIYGADFVLFHLSKCSNNTNLGSIDSRYILNDEPLTILRLFSNYEIIKNSSDFLLLKKRANTLVNNTELIKSEERTWKEWIEVPKAEEGILRVNFCYFKKQRAKIKELLYKGEYFQVDYKFSDGQIYSYRFNPETAISGLWVNPFIVDINNPELNKRVEFIRFSCSGHDLFEQQINLEWNSIHSGDSSQLIFSEARPTANKVEQILFSKTDFESKSDYWSWNSVNNDSLRVYSGKYSNRINRNGFSSSFIIPVDSIKSETGNIEFFASCQAFLNKKSNALFVFSIENEGKSTFWTSKSLDKLFSDEWNKNQFRVFVDLDQYKGQILNFYIWNPEGKDCYVDEMNISVSNKVDSQVNLK